MGEYSGDSQDKGFRDRLIALLDWVAEHDPLAAARLLAEYTDDLVEELGPSEALG